MTLHEKWEHIDHRLRMLDAADQEEEANLLSEAYERLIYAYHEADFVSAYVETAKINEKNAGDSAEACKVAREVQIRPGETQPGNNEAL